MVAHRNAVLMDEPPRQVSEVLASLHLPEDGEESWGRAVDMAHKAANCRQAPKQVCPTNTKNA